MSAFTPREVFALRPGTKLPAVPWSRRENRVPPEQIPASERRGVPTGPDNGIWVLDLDRGKQPGVDGLTSLKTYADGRELDTFAVRTPSGGLHLFFAWDDARPVRNLVGILPGVDVRGAGGYVVAGGVGEAAYVVFRDVPPAPAPAWLVELVTSRQNAAPPESAVAIGPDHPEWLNRLKMACAFIASEPPCVSGQGGQAQIWKMALRLMRTYELPIDTAIELLGPYNATCQPPWTDDELRHHLSNAATRGTGPTGTFRADFLARPMAAGNEAKVPEPDMAETPKTEFLRGDHVELAQEVIRTCGRKLVTAEGAIWAYDPERGAWTADIEHGANGLRALVVSKAGMPCGHKRAPLRINNSDVEGVIKLVRQLTEQPDFFANAPPGLACANGFVMLDGVTPHSSDHRARAYYPLAFDPGLRSETWERFLDDLFRDDSDKAEKIACLQEFFGGALFGLSTRFQKCLVATGGGSNGKSTLFAIIRALFPDRSVQAIPPKKWEHPFTLANFRGTLLNVVGDMPHGAIIDSEHFKEIVAGDEVQAEEKFKPSFPLRPIAGHAFACNELPATSDQSFGFWRRFIVLGFTRNFENDPSRDTTVAQRILASERPGILAWLVTGARRLLERGSYTVPTSHAEQLARWQRDSDTVAQFKLEHVTEETAAKYSASQLYTDYQMWATRNGYRPVASNRFARRMADLGCASVRDASNRAVYPVRCAFVALGLAA